MIVGPAVRAVGVGGDAHRARPRRAGAGLLHREDRGGQWRLSAELPAAERSRPRGVSYAAANGHHQFAALVPQTGLWRCRQGRLHGLGRGRAWQRGGCGALSRPMPARSRSLPPAVAKSGADAVLIAQGGVILRAIAPTLSLDGVTKDKVKLLGTGLWDDDAALIARSEPAGQLVCRARAQCRCRIRQQIPRRPSAPRRRSWRAWPMTRCRWWRCCRKARPITASPPRP